MRHFISFVLALAISTSLAFGQPDSCRLRISVITCAPGAELYSLFGHTALRITDSTRHQDVVFNYGTFDFSDPDFYSKFVRGKLDYFLNPEPFDGFMQFYQEEQRGITEQELNMTCAEKQALLEALKTNLQGSNKYYKYDFLFDNCTSRVRDQVQHNIPGVTMQAPLVPEGTTFRNMIHVYLDNGGQPWSKLGIDLLLGSRMDRPVTVNESMFLPDYLLKGVDSAKKGDKTPLVLQKKQLFSASPDLSPQNKHVPLIVFSVIAVVVLLLSQWKQKAGTTLMLIIDSIGLYVTGLVGVLLLFMWFCTDHVACAANYNLLWALPTNLLAGFFIYKRPTWVRKYFLYLAFLQIAVLVAWIFLPQQLNIAFLPVVIITAWRSFQLTFK
ncbi:protein of unknown function [Filimonas lacunae]|uniref:Uncharacterized protein n=1 Tax=Filimonas lacunae TaxID=477680 RepID=A0A173M9P7_9BACT|nr:DUF4105 domain-containing protein [Filimonas lacunae]BAV04198.1 hypothetical protein FLA_0177 [Filimonas lacunae]SIT14326.1 protein of unknown function [Filimonas lacunae]